MPKTVPAEENVVPVLPKYEAHDKSKICKSSSPGTLVYSTENFDLGEPDMSEIEPSFTNRIFPNISFPSATKVVIIQQCQNFNM